jgi:phosphatidylglycerol:prolipoprotein diacylglycerol transferase
MFPYLIKSDSFTIGSYGLMLAIAYLTGRWLFLNTLDKSKPQVSNTEILIILLLVFGVVGAKLMFIVKHSDKSSLLFSGTGFSSQGAILGAILATYLFTYFQKIKLYRILDAAAPAAILAYAIARIGCFLSGDDCYGTPTDLPWAMSFPQGIAPTTQHVHPVPLYEIVYSLAIFAVLLKRQNASNKPYSQFFALLGLWGVSRFLVEFVSSNPKIIFSMSGSQLGALLMFIFALIFFVHSRLQLKS